MDRSQEFEQRLAGLRAEARRGATAETFRGYEALCRAAREQGAAWIAAQALRDLATLTVELDPETARLLARAAESAGAAAAPAAERREFDASVIVLGLAAPATDAPVLASLERQTLPRSCFETLLADRSDARAINEAISAALGRVLVFVAPDVSLAADALARHVATHEAPVPPQLVLGALDREGLSLRPLAWSLERLGLLGCQHAPEDGGDLPPELVALDHASARREVVLRACGFDPSLSAFAGLELGARLSATGVRCVLAPQIRATRPAAIDLDGWLARARSMGADWLALRRRHGAGAPPSWLRDAGLEEAEREELLARLLADADVHERRVRSLRESLHEIEQVLARDPARADSILARLGGDLGGLVLEVTRHELMRGFVHAVLGGSPRSLEECATRTSRGAAVLVAGGGDVAAAAAAAVAELPDWAELVVAVPPGAAAPALPADRRVSTFALPAAGGGGALRRSLLAATGADFFVLLDGSCVPTRPEWAALRLTLAALPGVGACGVGDEPGDLARATLCSSLPASIVAARRDVIESDLEATDPFLDRVVRRGLRLATASAARTAEPSACPA